MHVAGLRVAILTVVCLVALWICASPANAQTCSFSATNLAFGSVQASNGQAVDAVATLTATCRRSGGQSSTVYICPNFGDGSGGSSGSDRTTVRTGGGTLKYQLYSNAARTVVWGSPGWQGNPPVFSYALPQANTNYGQNFTIYGRVMPSQQGAIAGSYSSSMSLTHVYMEIGQTPSVCDGNQGTVLSSPSFTISATVLAGCTVSITDVDFGSKGDLTAVTDAEGAVRVVCSSGTAWSAALALGTGETATARTMSNGATNITYGLYKDIARTQPWSTGTQSIGGTGNGLQQSITAYGRVPIQSTPVANTYTDTVIVNLTY